MAIGAPKHDGSLPAAANYIAFDSVYIRMTAFKKAEERDSVIVRLFNTTGETLTLNADVAPAFRGARLVNLAETVLSELTIQDGRLTMEILPKKIVTVEMY